MAADIFFIKKKTSGEFVFSSPFYEKYLFAKRNHHPRESQVRSIVVSFFLISMNSCVKNATVFDIFKNYLKLGYQMTWNVPSYYSDQ